AVVGHAAMATAGMLPRCDWLGPNLRRLPAAGPPAVALTFDDGPDPEVTPAVLDLLADHGARATFFVIGRRAAQHLDLAAEIVRRGHRLENHTQHHGKGFAWLGPRRLGREIDEAQAVIADVAGRAPRYLRAPAGIRSPFLEPVLARRGLMLASWTRRGFDTVDGDPERVRRRLLSDLAAGDVLLLHDGNAATSPGGRPVVLEVLPALLEALRNRSLDTAFLPEPAPVQGPR
ncbi:MAG: polysaccharide deacetylase family protein, partial [Acidobacteria bacterium]|nr:polysaccharide deacetylase family protein [Acidobacteriota bacterium]